MPHSVTSILAQIRNLHAQIPAEISIPHPAGITSSQTIGMHESVHAIETPSFIQTLKHAMEGVNSAQQHADALAEGFERGDPGADLAQVMVSAQQSQVAFRATVEVRNRLLQAYQDVLNMPM